MIASSRVIPSAIGKGGFAGSTGSSWRCKIGFLNSKILGSGAGVRAQAVERSGALVDDFRIVAGERSIHVLNAPSPAATASIVIGREIGRMAEEAFGL